MGDCQTYESIFISGISPSKGRMCGQKKERGLGLFCDFNYQNTTEEHAQIPLYSNELQKTAETVGERKQTRAKKQVTGMKTIFRITYPVN